MSSDSTKYLIFRVGLEEHAIPLLSVREVSSLRPTRPVPDTPAHFVGVTNLRGSVISILSLAKKLGVEPVGNDFARAILVFNIVNTTLGIIVDEVIAVRAFEENDIDRSGAATLPIPTQYVRGIAKIGERLVTLLDVPLLLQDDLATLAA